MSTGEVAHLSWEIGITFLTSMLNRHICCDRLVDHLCARPYTWHTCSSTPKEKQNCSPQTSWACAMVLWCVTYIDSDALNISHQGQNARSIHHRCFYFEGEIYFSISYATTSRHQAKRVLIKPARKVQAPPSITPTTKQRLHDLDSGRCLITFEKCPLHRNRQCT